MLIWPDCDCRNVKNLNKNIFQKYFGWFRNRMIKLWEFCVIELIKLLLKSIWPSSFGLSYKVIIPRRWNKVNSLQEIRNKECDDYSVQFWGKASLFYPSNSQKVGIFLLSSREPGHWLVVYGGSPGTSQWETAGTGSAPDWGSLSVLQSHILPDMEI